MRWRSLRTWARARREQGLTLGLWWRTGAQLGLGWGGCGGMGGNHGPAWENWCQLLGFSGTVEKYWDLFQHPALGTVSLSSFTHVTPSDTKWTLKALSVVPCIYNIRCVHMEAREGCPARLLGCPRPLIEPLSLPACLCPRISDAPRVRAAMPRHFKRPSKSGW